MQDHEDEHQVCKHLVDLFPEFPGPLRAALVTLAVRGHLRPGCGQTAPLLGAIAGGLSDADVMEHFQKPPTDNFTV